MAKRAEQRGSFLGVFLLAAGCALPGLLGATEPVGAAAEAALAREILDATGVRGGLIVHLGSGDGKLTAELRVNDRYQVHGLDADPADVETAREHIRSLGRYGPVSVDRLRGARLPYIDNAVNLLVGEAVGDVSAAEVLRVLVPRGVAYVKAGDTWTKTVKPHPANIDEWTHFFHDASGNAVAHDDVVGPPRHLQWIGSPRWSRHHDRMASMSALVSAGGRVFYIVDEGSRVSIQLPPKWTLIARDAFNGALLWKRRIPTWHNHLWPLKSGPTQLARRLVAVGERVYVTLGHSAPLTALEAASGETLRTYDKSRATEEVITSAGTLFLLVNEGEQEMSSFAPVHNVGDQGRVAREFQWNRKPRKILAVEADSGRVLWEKEARVVPLTLTADRRRVYYYDDDKVVCLDRSRGEELWTSSSVRRRDSIPLHFGPRVVVHQGVVLFAGGDRKMTAFAAESGKELWSAPHARGGYQSPEDLLVVGGLVWSAPTTSTRDSGLYTGRDLRTGDVKSEFPPDVDTYWFHHRCHMAKATDRFLLPSRTGIEFVDLRKKQWEIHHWVRGGCLYGIMPSNGLIYAPPHNCACYPEAKLYGFNALAPTSASRQVPRQVADAGRLERGPAYGDEISSGAAADSDWPTYRHDAARSGTTKSAVPSALKKPAWETELGGRLSSVVVAEDRLFVAQVDAHTVQALDARSGEVLWRYTAGGRVDSPPTIDGGRLFFGSADGWVYSLRARDGALIWRFRAAPRDQRLLAFEQLESVWPVHGSTLVWDGVVHAVAGRSNFLDGGLRYVRLDAKSGRKLSETIIDERDPETGETLQVKVQILNMPVGLPDILSSDGEHVYMRSQKFDRQGNRLQIGPHSGEPAKQGAVQRGEGLHLFAPMGFVDDTWFHRSYWVYGRSFAGGHSGYYQAGRFTAAGRILVFDESNVYGFGRKAAYYRWTTTIEHQLFSTSKTPPEVPESWLERRGRSPMIRFEKAPTLDPTNQPLAVEAWAKAERPNGVVVAHGGPARGYALVFQRGRPQFVVRVKGTVFSVRAPEPSGDRWVHLAGVLEKDGTMRLHVDGKLAGTTKASGLITQNPAQSLEIGGDDGGSVGDYRAPFAFTGLIDEVRVYHGTVTARDVEAHHARPADTSAPGAELVLACSFDGGDAKDESGKKNDGKVEGIRSDRGTRGLAMRFNGGRPRGGGSLVRHHWTKDLPFFVRAMVLADETLFLAGPPDVVDEEETFRRLTARDPAVATQLARQAAALEGENGGHLWAVSSTDGKKLAEVPLKSLPVWDGMAAARGRLYLATQDGKVVCFGE